MGYFGCYAAGLNLSELAGGGHLPGLVQANPAPGSGIRQRCQADPVKRPGTPAGRGSEYPGAKLVLARLGEGAAAGDLC